jgi:hypothetical protein
MQHVQTLIFGIVLILLIGIGGFFYRNVAERSGAPEPVACTMEAKLCSDGSSVGRVAPSCEFAPCPAETFSIAGQFIATVPSGYVLEVDPDIDREAGDDMTIVATLTKPALGAGPAHRITVHHLGVTPGEFEDDIVRATRFQPSDMPAESIDQFEKVILGGNTFYTTVIERFEGQVESAYYVPVVRDGVASDLLLFTLVERDVTNWTDPDLVITSLPEHQAFVSMLATLHTP